MYYDVFLIEYFPLVWSEFEEFFGQFGESLELAREALKNRIKCDELSLAEQFRLDELLCKYSL